VAQQADTSKHVTAVPAKRFFVGMLVKDIELIPAIVDLVDNSIDGAKRLRPDASDERYRGLEVKLTVSREQFEIEDNCGGIDLDWARDYAFRFGRPEDVAGPLGEVGQFGVGMKRALFKIGQRFTITSTTTSNAFTLPVDVAAWLSDSAPDWSFELSDVDEHANVGVEDTGTVIQVDALNPPIADELGNEQFLNRLRDALRLRQALVIAQGMKIVVNEVSVGEFEPALLSSDLVQPIFERTQVAANGDQLEMRLYAGLVRLRESDAELDDDDAEEFRQPPEAGWYLYCNDRLLLQANRTGLTGWGTAAAAYHPQYRQFRGYVLLDGDAKYMPWTTTKTSVDEDSAVFRAVQTAMFDALQKTQAAMNRIKQERQSSPEGERPGYDAVREAPAVPLRKLAQSARFVLPDPAPRRPAANVKWIRYSVDPEDFDAVASELGVTAALDVGRGTFDYYLQTQVPK
jgi:hypothetical protein